MKTEMKFSNKLNLPNYLCEWLAADDYDYIIEPLTLSTTTLMKPIRVFWLSSRYGDKFEIDYSDLIASRLGNAIHDSVERIETPNVSKEKRVIRELEIDGVTYSISGKYDVLVNKDNKWILRDIKTTSVWAFIYGGKDIDYQKQLSIYRWLLSKECTVEDVAFIDFIFTDWQATKAKLEENYPKQRIFAGYRIPLMSLQETEQYLIARLKEFYKNKDVPDNDLPFCNPEELWATSDTFAVIKPGAKRALKVCDSNQEAIDYINEKSIKADIEKRPGKAKRCRYCACRNWCNQYTQLQADNQIEYF